MFFNVCELKPHLSEYLRSVRQVESIDAAFHGRVIGHLVPLPAWAESAIGTLRWRPWFK
ncbi:MAG: hypothetical protein JWQ90_2636 [Hydrocarboniphaga sp.]|uniref:type II toxin-antitoxin system Phd/YefM family antitoxin n=1 Tax=Hydrocarboniphaga sp. TaxID=2033016 RepID=UPI002615EBD3|nr:hypothetical protein [Hydrocarboniphaga sp.]MDB5970186.1 hypothetical protein [Hydrocarboniphaga sp.]